MSLANLQVFNNTVQTTTTEMFAQQVELFNAATRGAITLGTKPNAGDYASMTKYQKLSGLVAERDIDSSASVSALDLVRILEGSVKVARRLGPVNLEPSNFDWILRSPDEPAAVASEQAAKDKLADMLNTAISAFVAATLNVGTTLYSDMGSSTTLTLSGLADGAQLLGDAAKNIACWIMHSKSWTELYKANLAGTNMLFNYGNVAIAADPLGRPIVITDSTDLVNSSDYYSLGIVNGGIVVEDNSDLRVITVEAGMTQNITAYWQGQYSYNLGLKGYKWDESHGGNSPSDAAIAVGTNWDKTATSVKDCAGIIVIAE